MTSENDTRELEADPTTIASMASFGILMTETEVQALADSYLELRKALEQIAIETGEPWTHTFALDAIRRIK